MEEVLESSYEEKEEQSISAWNFTISPKWLPLRLWEPFVVATTVISTTLVTYQASFDAESIWLMLLAMTMDIVYIVAMVLQFFTGYTRKGILVTNRRKIALHYLKTTLIPDVLSVIPLELFAIVAGDNILYSAVLLKLNRLLRCYRPILYCYEHEQHVTNHTNLYRAVRYTYLVWVSFHIQACAWFALVCDNAAVTNPRCRTNSWANTPSVIFIDINMATGPVFSKYIVSLYWAVTTSTTVGYGDIRPLLVSEQWFSVVTMVWGVVLFGYVLGGLGSALTNTDTQRARFIHHLNIVKNHLQEAGISKELKDKVINYYSYLWLRNKGKSGEEYLSELPKSLQTEISLENYQTLLLKSELFQDLPSACLLMLSTVVHRVLYLPRQVIVNRGDIEDNMFIIQNGLVEVLNDDDDVIAELGDGDVFGEVNLVCDIAARVMVRARTHCDVLQLSRSDVAKILEDYPSVVSKLKSDITMRCDNASENHVKLNTDQPETESSDVSPSIAIDQFKKLWERTQVLPESMFTVVWDLILTLTILTAVWLISFQASFSNFDPSLGYSYVPMGGLWYTLTYTMDIIFITDIVVSLKKAIQTPYGHVTDPRLTALAYIKSLTFIIDVLAVLPMETAASIISDRKLDHAITLKINRLLKFWKIIIMFSRLEGSLNYSIVRIRAVKFTIYILTLIHIAACGWFTISCHTNGVCRGWAAHLSINTIITTAIHDYILSLYWSVATTTTVGYGDITPVNELERVFALVVMVAGTLLYGYVLGSVAATITNIHLPRVIFQERMQVVHQLMSDNNLNGYSERVNSFFSLLWRQTRGEALPGEVRLFADLPHSLQEAISMEECSSLLDTIPFFKHADSAFICQLSLTTESYLFAPGDFIMYQGDMSREMYCVKRGYVEVLSEDLRRVVNIIKPGGYFGEVGFLFIAKRTASVRAASHCELMMVSRHHLDHVLESFPLMKSEFQSLSSNQDYYQLASEAAEEASRLAMAARPLTTPSVTSALSVAMTPPLSIITQSSLASCIASTADSKELQSKVSCPSSLQYRSTDTVTVKYNRTEDSMMMGREGVIEDGDNESTGLRTRKQYATCTSMVDDIGDSTDTQIHHQHESRWTALTSTLNRICSYCLIPYSFIPTSKPGVVWEVTVVILTIVMSITLSLQASFLQTSASLWVINYLLDVFFIADIILKLHTAYYTTEGVLVTEPLLCAKNYFKSNFLIDLLSSFPTDIVVLMIGSTHTNSLRILSLVRLNRLLKIYKLPLLFAYAEDLITLPTGILMELEFAVYIILSTHWAGCVWFLLASCTLSTPHTCTTGSWAVNGGFTTIPLSNHTIWYQYIASMYWASATTTSVGYGDIHAHTDLERVYALVVMILGVVGYGYIIAAVAASLTNADTTRVSYQERLRAIKSYLKDHGVGPIITGQVVDHYEYIWQRTKGLSISSLFNGMPQSLQGDVSLSLYKTMIDKVPLFQNTEIGFTKLLAMSIKPVLYLSNEYIVQKGDHGSEMFFISRGMVEVVSEDGTMVYATLSEGQFFGEISLIYDCPRTASIRALTNCDVYVLTKSDLDAALMYYPHISHQIHEVASIRSNLLDQYHTQEKDNKRVALNYQPLPTIEEDKDQSQFCLLECCCYSAWLALGSALTFVISPESKFNRFYSYTGCLIAYISALTISYQGFFQSDISYLWLLNSLSEVYFLVEIFIKFHVAYEDRKGRIVTDFKSVALHYLMVPSGFLLDIALVTPIELIALFIPNAHTRTSAMLYLRIIRVSRIVRIKQVYNIEKKRLNQQTVLVHVLKYIVLISLSTHFVACVWYLLGCQAGSCRPGTWAETAGFLKSPVKHSCIVHYCTSLYWAVATMTTTGYGDLPATNGVEMVYASAVMVIGKLLFGFILGSIVSALANLETQKVLFEDKLETIKEHMKDQQVSSSLQTRVMNYLGYLWLRNKGADRQELLVDMPLCMQAELSLAITHQLISNVPIFESFDASSLRCLSLMIKPCLYLPDEYIMHEGDIGHGMYFIYRGTVEVIKEDSVFLLSEGDQFGMRELLYNLPSEVSVRTKTHCDIFTLTREDFEQVMHTSWSNTPDHN